MNKGKLKMGRKRLEKTKSTLKLSIDSDLILALNETGVNKSRLFSIAAKIYLKKKNLKK